MSLPQRLRTNFLTGTIASLPAGSTTLTFTALSNALGSITSIISGTNYLPLIINPASYGSTTTSEVVWVVTYGGGSTATVMRGQEGTLSYGSNWANGTVFVNGPLVNDFGITNQITNGDFPIASGTGQILISASGSNSPFYASVLSGTTVSGYLPNVTISGPQLSGNIQTTQVSGTFNNQVVLPATQVSGSLSNATIPSNQVIGFVPATQISGTFNNQIVVPATQVSGALNNATISGNQITGVITATISGNISATQVSGTFNNQVIIPATQVSGLLSNSTIPGSQVTGNISATQVSGALNNATISGNQITGVITATISGNISATQVSGTFNNQVIIPATQVSGLLSNSTIPGSQVTGNISATQVSGALNNATISGVQIKGLTGGTNISVTPSANNLVITNTAVQPTGARSDGGGTTTKINSSIGYIAGYGQLSISGYTNYLVIIDGTVTNINGSNNSTINIGVGVDSTNAFSKLVNMYALSNTAMSYSYSFFISGLSTVAHTFNPLTQQTAGASNSTYLQESHITVIGLS